MPTIVYTAYSPFVLNAIVQASDNMMTKQMIMQNFMLPTAGDERYMTLPAAWRVLQSMLTGVDSPDNEFFTETFDGQHYLHGWSHLGAAWISAEQVVYIADALGQVDFPCRLQLFHEYQSKISRGLSSAAMARHDDIFSDTHEFNGISEEKRQIELKMCFQQLCDFYRASAVRGDGLIVEFV